MTFDQLGLIPPILSALREMDYQTPSPIQEKAIPPALQGRDVLGCAQTGTGKTCAFATPILQRLNACPAQGKPRPIRALILTPTRELALQIQESFEAYGKNLPLRSAVIFGGVGQQPQADKLKAGVDILVATPGRLQDLHDQGFVHVETLEIFVLDEADRMLDMGFIRDVKKILTWLPQKKQTLFFSATMPPEVQGLVDSLLVDPVKVAVDPVSSPVEVIDQKLYYVDRGNKSRLLASLVKEEDVKSALIFTRTKHGANKVATDLQKAGIPSAAIHGNKSQTARQQALADFKAGRIRALVATDIAARGIDIEELSHVFNYNLPDVPETYIHRIGRTGRAGHGGTAISFCEFGEKELLSPIEKLLKKPIPVVENHPWPMVSFEAPKRDKQGKLINPDDAEARQAARELKKLRDEARRTAEEKKPAPAPAPKPTQTPASGKRRSAGYKPSKTIDEALTSMAPRTTGETPGRDAAFEAWLAEERAIRAKRFRDDPLAGEVVMDATARLLAPKGSVQAQNRPKQSVRAEGLSQEDGKQQNKDRQLRAGQPPRKEISNRKPASSAGRAAVGGGPCGEPAKKDQAAAPAKKEPAKTWVNPNPTKHRDDRDRRRVESRRRPRPTSWLAQKDSTEQSGSLMKPYYFIPDEEED